MSVTQKVNDISVQLSASLLLKDQLTEQLEQTCERVKALRNLLAGVDLGRAVAKEEAKELAPDPSDHAE